MTDCMFLRRYYGSGGASSAAIIDLLTNATVIVNPYNPYGSNGAQKYESGMADSVFPSSGTGYMLTTINGYISMAKVVNRQSTAPTLLAYTGNLSQTDRWDDDGVWVYSADDADSHYGATCVAFTTSTANADTILSNATYTRLAGREASTSGTISTNNTSSGAVLATIGTNYTLWLWSGSSWTKSAFSSSTTAGTVSGSTITITGAYGASLIGLK